jgi:large subunit ribosomal protein L33
MSRLLESPMEPGSRADDAPRSGFRLCGNPYIRAHDTTRSRLAMAKATTIKVKLVSSADTGFYYVTRKNSRTMTDKLVKKKYDPVAKKHVEFRESKIK